MIYPEVCVRLFRPIVLILATLALVFAASFQVFAQSPPLTVEWISGAGSKVAEVPSFKWLDDGTAIVYDVRKPETERTFEKLDPASGNRTAILNMSQAVASLKGMVNDPEIKQALPWPEAIDSTGRRAVYEVKGDIFLLELPSSNFTRVTNTAEEEKDAQLSPDAAKIALRPQERYLRL